MPGDDNPDPELTELSTVGSAVCHRIWQYCNHGGADNIKNLLNYSSSLIGDEKEWVAPISLIQAGLYWPGLSLPDLKQIKSGWSSEHPINAIIFYRSLLQTCDLAPVDSLIKNLQIRNINPLPIFVTSLKDSISASLLISILNDCPPDVILNCTGFAVSSPGKAKIETPFSKADCPVIQVILSGSSVEDWRDGVRGLSHNDLDMNVALP